MQNFPLLHLFSPPRSQLPSSEPSGASLKLKVAHPNSFPQTLLEFMTILVLISSVERYLVFIGTPTLPSDLPSSSFSQPQRPKARTPHHAGIQPALYLARPTYPCS